MITRWRASVPGLLAVGWVLAAGIAMLVPALHRGAMLGSYDWLASFGVTQQHGVTPHNLYAGDQITQMIPWTNLAWAEVHHGQLPLWNPYSALGMPLAFNWQSATFSVPALVGYAVPLRFAYTVQILVTVWIAGTGTYALARVVGLAQVPAAWAGTVFELCGAFVFWIGWPIASVFAWSGWLFAAVVLIMRGQRRVRSTVFLAIAIAGAIYSGQPDALVLELGGAAIFASVILSVRAIEGRGLAAVVRSFADLVVAGATGVALAAPLLLPGLQLASASVRSDRGGGLNSQGARTMSDFFQIAFPGSVGDLRAPTFAYVGVITVVLAAAAVRFGIRRPEVIGLVAVGTVAAALTFVGPVIDVMNQVPGMHAIRFPRELVLVGFSLAVLSAIGLDVLLRSWRHRTVPRFVERSFVAAAGILLVAVVVEGARTANGGSVLRSGGFIWTIVCLVVGWATVRLAVGAIGGHPTDDVVVRRTSRGAAAVLLVISSTFLVASGSGFLSSSPTGFPSTPQTRELQSLVGSSLVGFGSPGCVFPPALGFRVNTNVAYAVHELGVYDPMTPRSYYQAWFALTGSPGGVAGVSHYCPAVTTVAQARLYGVSYILEPINAEGPPGTSTIATIAGDRVVAVPGSGPATLTPLADRSHAPSVSALGRLVPASHPDPATWLIRTNAAAATELRLRLSNVPGWTATLDGHPLTLQQFAGIMLQAHVTPGRHEIRVTYWPSRFTLGLEFAGIAVLGIGVATAIGMCRRRRSRGEVRRDFSPN